MENHVLTGLFLAACLALSFLLSGMEAGVFALNRLRVRQLARAGRPSARLLHNFLEHPENFLWTILVGNTLANFIILGWVVATLHDYFPGRYGLITGLFTGMVFLFYALFDLLPKMLFRAHPNQLCLSAARIFWPVHLILRPLVAVVETSAAGALRWTGGHAFTGRPFGNREEMRAVMQESAQAFTTGERAMINRVLDLQTFTVRQIAMPLAQVVTVETSTLDRRRAGPGPRTQIFSTAGLGNPRRQAAHGGAAHAGAAVVPRRPGSAKTRRRPHDPGAVSG